MCIRNRLRFGRDRVSAEHLLHRDPGVGSVLPAAVFPARAALGQLQTQLEHPELRGGHRPQEQKPLGLRQHHQPHQPHLAGHRVLGVSIESSWGCVYGTVALYPFSSLSCRLQAERPQHLFRDRRGRRSEVGPGAVPAGRLGHLLLLHLERSQIHRQGEREDEKSPLFITLLDMLKFVPPHKWSLRFKSENCSQPH